jgi:hypothetical protein
MPTACPVSFTAIAADATAIAIVSISAGAVVTVGSAILNTRFAASQARGQFAHEREMSDVAELRGFLERAITALQEVVDSMLDLSGDIDVVSGTEAAFSEELIVDLVERTQNVREMTSRLRLSLVGIFMRLGLRHPIALQYQEVMLHVLAVGRAIPDELPASAEARKELDGRLEVMSHAQGAFLALAAGYVGVSLPDRGAAVSDRPA